MNRILIIGGCGYIGSRLYLFLKEKKCVVDTVDTEWFGNFINKKNIKLDYKKLSKKFLNSYDVVILLAGYSSVKMCEGDMIGTFTNNVANFVHLLRKIQNQVFIYASSSSVYGNTKKISVTEAYDRYYPANYYDLSKKEIDYYAQLSNVNYYGLRFGTVNGYSPNLRVDLMINKMYSDVKKSGVINIYNPGVNRPILGIRDLCNAVARIIEKKGRPGIYNITSYNSTVRSIAISVKKALKNIQVIEDTSSIGYNFSISTKKFEKEFSFKFKDTSESIIRDLVKNYNMSNKTIRVSMK